MQLLVAQPCLTLCNPMDCSLPVFSAHEILQARILECVAIPFSRGYSWHRNWILVSCMQADFLPSEPPGKPKVLALKVIKLKNWRISVQPFRTMWLGRWHHGLKVKTSVTISASDDFTWWFRDKLIDRMSDSKTEWPVVISLKYLRKSYKSVNFFWATLI